MASPNAFPESPAATRDPNLPSPKHGAVKSDDKAAGTNKPKTASRKRSSSK